MAETMTNSAVQKKTGRATQVGQVVSTKMDKTIVVKVDMKKAHALYRRVIKRSKKYYAHDAENKALVGDIVRIEETRPMSKLKRWRLLEIVRRPALAAHDDAAHKAEKRTRPTEESAS